MLRAQEALEMSNRNREGTEFAILEYLDSRIQGEAREGGIRVIVLEDMWEYEHKLSQQEVEVIMEDDYGYEIFRDDAGQMIVSWEHLR